MQIKKIESKKDIEKRERKNQLAIGLILISIMILSTAGYAFERTKQEKKIYKDVVFINDEKGFWTSEKLGTATKFLPQEVNGINGSILISKSSVQEKVFYFDAFSSNEFTAANEIASNLLPSKTQQVCIEGEENKEGCENLPIKSCSDERLGTYIFIFKSEENSTLNLEKKDNCLFFNGGEESLIKAADKFIFMINNVF